MSNYIEITNNNTKVIDDETTHLRFTEEHSLRDDTVYDNYLERSYDGLWFSKDGNDKLIAIRGSGFTFCVTNLFVSWGQFDPKKKDSNRILISGMNRKSLHGFDAHGLSLRPESIDHDPFITGDNSFFGKNIDKSDVKIYTVEQGVGDVDSNSGMQIFNEEGQVIFDSKNRYTDILDIVHFTGFNTDFNKEYKYNVPIAIVPLDMSAYNSLHYGRRRDNNSYVELVACYLNTPNSFKLVKMKKTGASGTTWSFSKDSFVTNQTLLLVLDATSIS